MQIYLNGKKIETDSPTPLLAGEHPQIFSHKIVRYFYTSLYRKQLTSWSLTIPVACMCAYTTVEPTNLNPRFLRSMDIRSDNSVVAGADL